MPAELTTLTSLAAQSAVPGPEARTTHPSPLAQPGVYRGNGAATSVPTHDARAQDNVQGVARALAAERALQRLQRENDELKRREVALLQERRSLRAVAQRLRAELEAMGSTVVQQTVTMKAFASEMERYDPCHLVRARRAAATNGEEEVTALRAEVAQLRATAAALEQQRGADAATIAALAQRQRDAHAARSPSRSTAEPTPERIDRDDDDELVEDDDARHSRALGELQRLLGAYEELCASLLRQRPHGGPSAQHRDAHARDEALYRVQLRVLSCHHLRRGDAPAYGEVYVVVRGPRPDTCVRTTTRNVNRHGDVVFAPTSGAALVDCGFAALPDTEAVLRLEVCEGGAGHVGYRAAVPIRALLAPAVAENGAAAATVVHTLPLTPVHTSRATAVASAICVEATVSDLAAALRSCVLERPTRRGVACESSPVDVVVVEVAGVTCATPPVRDAAWLVVVYDEDAGDGLGREVLRTHMADGTTAEVARVVYGGASNGGKLRFCVYDAVGVGVERETATSWRRLPRRGTTWRDAATILAEATLAKDALPCGEDAATAGVRRLPLLSATSAVWGTLEVRCWWRPVRRNGLQLLSAPDTAAVRVESPTPLPTTMQEKVVPRNDTTVTIETCEDTAQTTPLRVDSPRPVVSVATTARSVDQETAATSPHASTTVAGAAAASDAPTNAARRVEVYVREGRQLMQNGDDMLDVLGVCDPRVLVWCDEELVCTVPEVHAALQPRWPREVGCCTIDLKPEQVLRFEVQDVQVTGIDPMGTASVRGSEVLQRAGEHELPVRLAGKQYGTLVVVFTLPRSEC